MTDLNLKEVDYKIVEKSSCYYIVEILSGLHKGLYILRSEYSDTPLYGSPYYDQVYAKFLLMLS